MSILLKQSRFASGLIRNSGSKQSYVRKYVVADRRIHIMKISLRHTMSKYRLIGSEFWQHAPSCQKLNENSEQLSQSQRCSVNVMNDFKIEETKSEKDRERKSSWERHSGFSGITSLAVFGGLFSFSSTNEEEKKDPLIYKLKKARLAEMRRNFPEADKMYHEALSVLYEQESKGEIAKKKALQAKVYIFDNMANLALASRRIEQAEALFKETLKGLFQLQYPRDDNAVTEISIKIAMCHALQKKFEEAELGYKFCVDNMRNKLAEARKMGKQGEELDPDVVALTGMSYDAYSRFLLVQKRIKEGLEMNEHALDLAKEVFGENHPQVAVLLSDKATSLTMMGEYTEAEKYLQRAIKVAYAINSEDLSVYYCNLGAVMIELNRLNDAFHACKKAKSLAGKAGNTDALDQAEVCLSRIQEKRNSKN